MEKILNLIFLLILFINVVLVLLGADIRKIKILKISWIFGIGILAILFYIKLIEPIIDYSIFSIMFLALNLGMNYTVYGECFPDKEKLNIDMYKIKNFLVMFLTFWIIITIWTVKRVLLDDYI